jgi:hypothetical protein
MTRHALLQQQLGGLHSWVRVKALHHRIAKQRVRQRHHGHACVVSKVGADHCAGGGAVRFSRGVVVMVVLARGVVDGVKKSIVALEARTDQLSQVGRALRSIDHRGERRGIGSHHQFVADSSRSVSG